MTDHINQEAAEAADHSMRSSSSEEEVDQPEQNSSSDLAGTGRSYECVFCKRGFTTAQALGGHMNIHRKDRAKNRPPPAAAAAAAADYFNMNPRFHGQQQIPSYYPPSRYADDQAAQVINNYLPYDQLGYTSSSSSSAAAAARSTSAQYYYHGDSPQQQRLMNPYGDDWRMSCLSLQFGSPHAGNEEKKREEDDLDLELRLGHN